jgi:hypothetical protein
MAAVMQICCRIRTRLSTVILETLIEIKLAAGRPKDLLVVAILEQMRPGRER